MSWRVTWCGKSAAAGAAAQVEATAPSADSKRIHGQEALSEQAVMQLLRSILQSASDISITETPPDTQLGGVPFPNIADALKEKRAIPFIGAGVPYSARPRGAEWERGSPFLPSGAELARHLAFLCNFPAWKIRDTENLARVASYYTFTNPGANLAKRLRSIFRGGQPTKTHILLAEPALHPMLLVTTNYDTLMEQALESRGVPYDLVIHRSDIDKAGCILVRRHGDENPIYMPPSEFVADLSTRTVLYKMHGSISRNGDRGGEEGGANFVITEEDYVTFLAKISALPPVVPSVFRQHFKRCSFLFLGYSLEDWNVRVILDRLDEDMSDEPSTAVRRDAGDAPAVQNGSPTATPSSRAASIAHALNRSAPAARQHWAIQHQPSSSDIEVWNNRGVLIRSIDLNEFAEQIRNPGYELFD